MNTLMLNNIYVLVTLIQAMICATFNTEDSIRTENEAECITSENATLLDEKVKQNRTKILKKIFERRLISIIANITNAIVRLKNKMSTRNSYKKENSVNSKIGENSDSQTLGEQKASNTKNNTIAVSSTTHDDQVAKQESNIKNFYVEHNIEQKHTGTFNTDKLSLYDSFSMSKYNLKHTIEHEKGEVDAIKNKSKFITFYEDKGCIEEPLDGEKLKIACDLHHFYPVLGNYKYNCYVNVILQALYNFEIFVSEVLDSKNETNDILNALKYYFIDFIHTRECNQIFVLTEKYIKRDNKDNELQKDCRDFFSFVFNSLMDNYEVDDYFFLDESNVKHLNGIQNLFLASYEQEYSNHKNITTYYEYFLQIEIQETVQKSLDKKLLQNEKCKTCKECVDSKECKKQKITKKINYTNHPNILVIVLDRLKTNQISKNGKTEPSVIYDTEAITVEKKIYLPTECDNKDYKEFMEYNLKSFVRFTKISDSGHFTICCKKDSTWRYIDDQLNDKNMYLYDDEAITHILKNNKDAYMLFYEKTNKS
ncbi:hypothetical protein BDAP_001794 [Binucleata daphniae]